MNDDVSAYGRGRAAGGEALRVSLLDIASTLLSTEGPQALTMRRMAAAAGCSTTVLYTVFGGKDGIAEALFREGFARFADRLRRVPEGPDPLARLAALGEAYRRNALEHRAYYDVMFGRAIPGFEPSIEAQVQALATLEAIRNQVRVCMDAGVFAPGDPQEVAEVLWAAAHGAVSLELAGFFADAATAEQRFSVLLTAAGLAFLAPSHRQVP